MPFGIPGGASLKTQQLPFGVPGGASLKTDKLPFGVSGGASLKTRKMPFGIPGGASIKTTPLPFGVTHSTDTKSPLNKNMESVKNNFIGAYLKGAAIEKTPVRKEAEFVSAYINGLTKEANRADELAAAGAQLGTVPDAMAGDLGEGAVNAYNAAKSIPGQIKAEIAPLSSGGFGANPTALQRAYLQSVADARNSVSDLNLNKSGISTATSNAGHLWNAVKAPYVGGSYEDVGREGGRGIGGLQDLSAGLLAYPGKAVRALSHNIPVISPIIDTTRHFLDNRHQLQVNNENFGKMLAQTSDPVKGVLDPLLGAEKSIGDAIRGTPAELAQRISGGAPSIQEATTKALNTPNAPGVLDQAKDFIGSHGKELAIAGGAGLAGLGVLGLYGNWKKNQEEKKRKQQQAALAAQGLLAY